MSDDRSIRVRLIAEYQTYVQGLRTAAAATADFGRNVSGLGKTQGADLEKFGRAALIMGGGLAVGFGLAAKAAIDWESAWAGVTKTVDGTTAQMADLEAGLREMATELPATHAEIAAVAEAAGALGVKREAIEGFTKTMIDLGETTDLTADQAATAMAQIANVMQTPQTEFDRMGATLVELGNNGASTESEILELANRLAAAGKIAGLSEADVFAFASTLASVGVEAEAGGTAISKVFTRVRDAVIDGGEELEIFAKVAGVSAESFAAKFNADPAQAVQEFIAGLGRMNEAGLSTSDVFKDLELNDERLKRALLSTAGAGQLLTDQILMGRKAWEDNTALQTEAEKRYATTAAQMEMLRNTVVDLGIDIGSSLLPAINAAVDVLSSLALGFTSLPGPIRAVTMGLGGVALGTFGMIAGAALLLPKIRALQVSLIAMGSAGRVAAASMPWLAAAAAGIAAVTYALGQNAAKTKAAEESAKTFTDAIRETGSVTEGTQSVIEGMVSEGGDMAELLDKTGTSIDDVTTALNGSDAEFKRFKDNLVEQAKAAGVSDDAMLTAIVGVDSMRTAAQDGAEDAEALGRVLGNVEAPATRAAGGLSVVTGSAEDQAEAAKDAKDAFEELIDAYRASVDPLFSLQEAAAANSEAMGAEAAARAQGAADIAEAAGAVSDAEKDLRDARGQKDNADGIAAAEERLADARERLVEVSADAAITAEEQAAFDRDAAQSALDLEVRARELAAAIADGTVDVEDAKGMLMEWVAQGSLTADQAARMAEQFDNAAEKADDLAGDYVASVYLVGMEEVNAQLDGLLARLQGLTDIGMGMSIDALQAESQIMRRAGNGRRPTHGASGNNFLADSWGVVGENGPELAYFGEDARVFSHGKSKQMVGGMFHGGDSQATGMGQGSGGGSYDYSKSNVWQPQFNIVAPSPSEGASAAEFRLRRLAIEAAA